MKEQLELKHLAPYLPYGLKVQFIGNLEDDYKRVDSDYIQIGEVAKLGSVEFRYVNPIYWMDFTRGYFGVNSVNFKPILRPLSDLTKEIDHNGEKFVPMIRLLELKERNQFSKDELLRNCSSLITVNVISCESKKYNSINMVCHELKYLVETSNMGALVYSFSYDEHFDRFSKRDLTRKIPLGVGHQKQLFEKLYEWRFDLNNLIDKGLAIDINTLDHV